LINFDYHPHLPLLVYKIIFNKLSQIETNLCGEDFVAPFTIILNDDAQCNVTPKLSFDEVKSIFKHKTS